MCLFTKSRAYNIAEEDITCYKVVIYNEKSDIYYSAVRYYPIASGSKINGFLQTEKIKLEFACKKIESNDEGEFLIGQGFIHSFESIEDVTKAIGNNILVSVLECVIPKGAIYYKGINVWESNVLNGFASRELRYIKDITCKFRLF